MNPALLALAAAVVLAAAAQTSKQLAISLPHRQLVGPLLLLNCLLIVPLALVSDWRANVAIVLLQVASAATLVGGSFCVFELFREGSAASVAVGQAIAPVPALGFSFLLLAVPVTVWQATGDLVVTVAVLVALGPVFGQLSRTHAAAIVVLAAALNGLLIVLTKLLTDRGVGVGEIYVTRTSLAGLAACLLVPPRDIPLGVLPQLLFRSGLQTAYFVLLILAVERGNPATVQTLVATTPLMLLGGKVVARHEWPPLRLALAALGVVAGVALAVT